MDMTGIAAEVAGATGSAGVDVGAAGSGARERALPASQANNARGIITLAGGDILKRTQRKGLRADGIQHVQAGRSPEWEVSERSRGRTPQLS